MLRHTVEDFTSKDDIIRRGSTWEERTLIFRDEAGKKELEVVGEDLRHDLIDHPTKRDRAEVFEQRAGESVLGMRVMIVSLMCAERVPSEKKDKTIAVMSSLRSGQKSLKNLALKPSGPGGRFEAVHREDCSLNFI